MKSHGVQSILFYVAFVAVLVHRIYVVVDAGFFTFLATRFTTGSFVASVVPEQAIKISSRRHSPTYSQPATTDSRIVDHDSHVLLNTTGTQST